MYQSIQSLKLKFAYVFIGNLFNNTAREQEVLLNNFFALFPVSNHCTKCE